MPARCLTYCLAALNLSPIFFNMVRERERERERDNKLNEIGYLTKGEERSEGERERVLKKDKRGE